MTYYKSLLILSYFCLFYPSFSLSKAPNDASNNIQGSYINISKSAGSNFTIQPLKEILNQSFEECDCGLHSISCRLDIYGKKKCTCEYGYTALLSFKTYEEECRICDCGQNSMFCKAGENGRKKCTCKDGYGPKLSILNYEEYCEVCDCGKGAESCRFDYIRYKKCTCRKGYAPNTRNYTGEICEKCNCGIDELSCQFGFKGERICKCGEDSVVVSSGGNQKCEKCNCGPNSISCQIVIGIKTCICKEGYVADRFSWSSDEYCSLDKSIFPWKSFTYIVIAIYAVIIMALFVTIFRKRRNM